MYASAVVWIKDWEVINSETVAATIQTVLTLNSQTNGKFVSDAVEATFRNASKGGLPRYLEPYNGGADYRVATLWAKPLSPEVQITGVSLGNNTLIGGDNLENGYVFCTMGEEAVSDAQQRQTCSPCAAGYFKPLVSQWGGKDTTVVGDCNEASETSTSDGQTKTSSPISCVNRLCQACPEGGNCNTTGVVLPGRLDGWWRSLPGQASINYDEYQFYPCLDAGQCVGTRPQVTDYKYGSPNNSQCVFNSFFEEDGDMVTCLYPDNEDGSEVSASTNAGADDGCVNDKTPECCEARGGTPVSFNEGAKNGGPLCAICDEGYFLYNYRCLPCPEGSAVPTVTTLTCIVSAVFLGAVIWYLDWIPRVSFLGAVKGNRGGQGEQGQRQNKTMHRSGSKAGGRTGGASTNAGRNSSSSTSLFDGAKSKIVLSFLQISSVYNIVYDVKWPGLFIQLINFFQFFININLLSLPMISLMGITPNLALTCDKENFSTVNFFDAFLFSFGLPFVLTAVFIVFGVVGHIRHQWFTKGGKYRTLFRGEKVDKRDRLRAKTLGLSHVTKCYQLFFFMLLIVYPSVCRVTLQMLSCKQIDETYYLAADYTIRCDTPRYRRHYFLAWCSVMALVIGIPAVMFMALWKGVNRSSKTWGSRVFILYASYKPDYPYFEVYDLIRKLFLTGIIIFVRPGTVTQIATATAFCMAALAIHLNIRPFLDAFDNLLQTMALVCILGTMYVGLLIRAEVTTNDETIDRSTITKVLVGANLIVILVLGPIVIPRITAGVKFYYQEAMVKATAYYNRAKTAVQQQSDARLVVRQIGSLTTLLEREDWDVVVRLPHPWATVDEVKEAIAERLGVPARTQCLYANERELAEPLLPITSYGLRVRRKQELPKVFMPFAKAVLRCTGIDACLAHGGDWDRYYRGSGWGGLPVLFWFRINPRTLEVEGEGFCAALSGDFRVSGRLHRGRAQHTSNATRMGSHGYDSRPVVENDHESGTPRLVWPRDRFELKFSAVKDPSNALASRALRDVKHKAKDKHRFAPYERDHLTRDLWVHLEGNPSGAKIVEKAAKRPWNNSSPNMATGNANDDEDENDGALSYVRTTTPQRRQRSTCCGSGSSLSFCGSCFTRSKRKEAQAKEEGQEIQMRALYQAQNSVSDFGSLSGGSSNGSSNGSSRGLPRPASAQSVRPPLTQPGAFAKSKSTMSGFRIHGTIEEEDVAAASAAAAAAKAAAEMRKLRAQEAWWKGGPPPGMKVAIPARFESPPYRAHHFGGSGAGAGGGHASRTRSATVNHRTSHFHHHPLQGGGRSHKHGHNVSRLATQSSVLGFSQGFNNSVGFGLGDHQYLDESERAAAVASAYAAAPWGPLPLASYKAGDTLLPFALRGYAEALDPSAFAERQAKRRRAAAARASNMNHYTHQERSSHSSNGKRGGGRASRDGSSGGGSDYGDGKHSDDDDDANENDGEGNEKEWPEPSELFACEALTRADFYKEAEQQRYHDATVVLVMRDDIGDIKLAQLTQVGDSFFILLFWRTLFSFECANMYFLLVKVQSQFSTHLYSPCFFHSTCELLCLLS